MPAAVFPEISDYTKEKLKSPSSKQTGRMNAFIKQLQRLPTRLKSNKNKFKAKLNACSNLEVNNIILK
jgi:flagellar biosynthesis chaperone FliJ